MADMTGPYYKQIETFANDLPKLRAQVSDRELLDQCQQYLTDLLQFSHDLSDSLPQNGGTSQAA